jgi:hypothetical protein
MIKLILIIAMFLPLAVGCSSSPKRIKRPCMMQCYHREMYAEENHERTR